jgi:hypothetical protein
MATVAPEVRPVKPKAAPVRRGTCNLRLHINGDVYSIRKHKGGSHARLWALKKLTGARAGRTLLVGRIYAQVCCDCEDYTRNQPTGGCKHIKALRALGLIARKSRRSRSQVPSGSRPAVLPMVAARSPAPSSQPERGVECPF